MDKTPVYNGKRIKMICTGCGGDSGTWREGRAFRNRIRWVAQLDCGHIQVMGYVAPIDTLEEMGLTNTDGKFAE